jgi:hypothetical protein
LRGAQRKDSVPIRAVSAYLVIEAKLLTLGGESKRKRRARLSCDMR